MISRDNRMGANEDLLQSEFRLYHQAAVDSAPWLKKAKWKCVCGGRVLKIYPL